MTRTIEPLRESVDAPVCHIDEEGVGVGQHLGHKEWMNSQMRMAAQCVMELLRPHTEGGSHEKVQDEETGYHLAQVHSCGYLEVPESFQYLTKHEEASPIMADWISHFGKLLNGLARTHHVPYEIVRTRIESFQSRLIGHVRHMSDIYAWNSQGQKSLRPSEAWQHIDWAEPTVIHDDLEGDRVRQVVYVPEVVGLGSDTELRLDKNHFSRQSLDMMVRPHFRVITEESDKNLASNG